MEDRGRRRGEEMWGSSSAAGSVLACLHPKPAAFWVTVSYPTSSFSPPSSPRRSASPVFTVG